MAMERDENRDITFSIKDQLGVVNEKQGGWRKELNIIQWNGGDIKYDIRDWSPDHKKMGKGITLFDYEMEKIAKLYLKFLNDQKKKEDRAFYAAKERERHSREEERETYKGMHDNSAKDDFDGGSGMSGHVVDEQSVAAQSESSSSSSGAVSAVM